jgi:hypothetical protein
MPVVTRSAAKAATAVCAANKPLCDAFIAESLRTPVNRERYQSKAREIAASVAPVTEADLRDPYDWPGRSVLQMARVQAGGQDALFPPAWGGLLEDDVRIADAVELLRASVEHNRGKTYNAWCDMGCPNDHREDAMDYYGDFEIDVQEWLLEQIQALVLGEGGGEDGEEPAVCEGVLKCERCGKMDWSLPLCVKCWAGMDSSLVREWMDSGRLLGEEREKKRAELRAR